MVPGPSSSPESLLAPLDGGSGSPVSQVFWICLGAFFLVLFLVASLFVWRWRTGKLAEMTSNKLEESGEDRRLSGKELAMNLSALLLTADHMLENNHCARMTTVRLAHPVSRFPDRAGRYVPRQRTLATQPCEMSFAGCWWGFPQVADFNLLMQRSVLKNTLSYTLGSKSWFTQVRKFTRC